VGAAADPYGVWMVWSEEVDGRAQLHRLHLGCDGVVDVPAALVSSSPVEQDDPVAVWGHDRLLVAWSEGFGGDAQIFLQPMDGTGKALGEARAVLPVRAEGVVEGSGRMPDLLVSEAGFDLAGSWEISGAPPSQVLVVRLDTEGVPLDSLAVDAFADRLTNQQQSSLARLADGSLRVVWQEGDQSAEPSVQRVELAVGATEAGIRRLIHVGGLSPGASGEWVSLHDGDGVWILAPEGPSFRADDATLLEHTASVVVAEDGGIATWYGVVSGQEHDVRVARFGADASLREALTLETETALPYPLAPVWLGGDRWFVAWQAFEGLEGRFVEFP
jgi:hypothetical protein